MENNELTQCQVLIQFALNELMKGRTFYEDYYKNVEWESLSRTDKAICILLSYSKSIYSHLGEPIGFEQIKNNMTQVYNTLEKINNE